MRFFLLYLGEKIKFDENLILQILKAMPGASKVKVGQFIGACIEASFDFEDDSTIIRLKPDRETIAISGVGKASLQAAYRLQSEYPKPIHMIDADYSFDVVLSEFRDYESLCKSIGTD